MTGNGLMRKSQKQHLDHFSMSITPVSCSRHWQVWPYFLRFLNKRVSDGCVDKEKADLDRRTDRKPPLAPLGG